MSIFNFRTNWWWWWWWWWWSWWWWRIVFVVCFYSLTSSWDHCQKSSPSRISDTPRAAFEPAQNLSSGLVEWSCAVVRTTTPRRHNLGLTGGKYLIKIIFDIKIEIGIFKISNVPNFNKSWALLVLGQIWAEQVVNI